MYDGAVMNVLVVNIGSTSFKFRLLEMPAERALASGTIENVGKPRSDITTCVGDTVPVHTQAHVADQAAAVETCLRALAEPHAGTPLAIDAVGFKAVHGGGLPGAVRVTPEVIRVMEEFAEAAPAHNPHYVAAMRALARQMPDVAQVAAFETGFHLTIPEARTTYAIPHEWTQRWGVRRYGFHGASHRYVATRVAALHRRDDLRLISCHLGGSSSICAIAGGRSVANSFGMTPQSGIPQNNRVGDFDAYALYLLRARTGKSFETLLEMMATGGGLLGISGRSNDMREILAAADAGDARARLALDTFVEGVRHYVGAYFVALGGLDVLTFTGGIGQRCAEVRELICAGLDCVGVRLDPERNAHPAGDVSVLSPDGTRVVVYTLATNEELIVARQVVEVLSGGA